MSATVEFRGTNGDLLHEVVRTGFAEQEQTLGQEDRRLPAHVRREVERFLGCGDPERGFAWLMCADCDHHRLVPGPDRAIRASPTARRPRSSTQLADEPRVTSTFEDVHAGYPQCAAFPDQGTYDREGTPRSTSMTVYPYHGSGM